MQRVLLSSCAFFDGSVDFPRFGVLIHSGLLMLDACVPADPFRRILARIVFEDSIEIGRMFFQSERPVKEFFGCDRKEFGFIGGSIGAEK